MKRHVAFSLLLICFLASASDAATNSADNGLLLSWRQVSRNEWLIEFSLPDLTMDSVELSATQWTRIACAGLSSYTQPGGPDLPCATTWIPAHVELSAFELAEQQVRTISLAPPLPVPQPLDRAIHASMTYLPDEGIYTRSAPYPGELLEVVFSGTLGRTPMTQVRICPLQYNPAAGTLDVFERLVFRVTFPPGHRLDGAQSRSGFENELIPDLVALQMPVTPPAESTASRMLIVTSPEYVEALADWREFKRACGLLTEVVIFSDVASTAATLRTYLQARYDETPNPPEFLFIIGDHDQIPAFFGVGSSLTDHPYSCLEGEDFLPDLSVGRLPVSTVTQLSQWLSRALSYERDGNVSATGEATVFSSSVALDPEHGQQVNSVFQNAGLRSTALQQPQTGALPLLMSELIDQPLWTFYIGHGNAQSWSSVAPHFSQSALPQFDQVRQGMVVSVACATADFDESANCIAEEWLLALNNGGALCYIGATESTAFFYSDTIGLATLEAVFDLGYKSIGRALDYGKLRCSQFFPQAPGGLTEETIQQFVLFGDPSLRPFTAAPVSAQRQIPETLPLGTTHIPVSVRFNNRGVPDVDVVLSSPTAEPTLVQTDEDGFALIPLPNTGEHVWTVTTRGLNIVPTQNIVTVAPVAGPILQLQMIELEESTGDFDGRADRGEAGTLAVLLRNVGTAPSTAGTLRLESSGSFLTITNNRLDLPALQPQTEEWLLQTASYSIAHDAADGFTAQIQAWSDEDENSTFVGNTRVTVHAPRIELERQWLTELTGDGDRLPEAGELLGLCLAITNSGSEPLRLPTADCFPDHDFLHIDSTRWSSDSIEPSEKDTIRYTFRCDSITPRGYPFEYTASLSGANQQPLDLWGRFRIGRVPVLLYVLDSQPQQVAGIQGALQVLGIEYETATVLPTDLSRFSSIWIFCGVHPNQEPLQPQSAVRIARYLDDGGACYWEGGDVWAFDYETELHDYFGIDGVSDGASDAGPLEGVRGRFTEGMQFTYGGENSFIDRIRARSSAVEILNNTRTGANYALAVANRGETYQTVGSSVELGALQDGEAPSTRVHLVRRILEWFEIPVLHDLTPPAITHIPPGVWHNSTRPIPILADVQDESELDFVACDFQVNGGDLQTTLLRNEAGGYLGLIPAQPIGSIITYRLRAADRSFPQNTTVTDVYTLLVQSYQDRLVNVIPRTESLFSMRKRGANGTFSVTGGASDYPAVVLIGDKTGRVSSYVSESVNVSHLSNPRFSFHSEIAGVNPNEPVIARVLASVDGGATFPHLIWRQGPADLGEVLVEEDNLTCIAGQTNVVFKFIYYGDKFWRFDDAVLSESPNGLEHVRNLVVVPGDLISLHWAPSAQAGVSYQISATPSLSQPFVPLATTRDSFFVDADRKLFPQRFYRVGVLPASSSIPPSPTKLSRFERIAKSFDHR